MKKLTLLLTPFLFTPSLFALVTIAPVEIGAKPGLSGKAAVTLETKRGNTDKQNYKTSLRLNYDDNSSSVTWAEISTEYGESNDQKDTDKAFAHLRHIRTTGVQDLRAEAFTQVQDDKFKLIKNRTLFGAGLRYKLFSLFGKDKGFVGLGAMNETINYTSNDPHENNQRMNSYIAYSSAFGHRSRVSLSFYYQPKLNELPDHVTSTDFELKLFVIDKLYLQFKVAYDTDSNPPMGVRKYDLTQNTSFIYEF
ncbi:MAG: DUF481 domain-containing protein [Sulfurimonas sp.]|jgi:hypothetical protein|nr:DUF481 domain-containing protein [Sulfurimonas sp.]